VNARTFGETFGFFAFFFCSLIWILKEAFCIHIIYGDKRKEFRVKLFHCLEELQKKNL